MTVPTMRVAPSGAADTVAVSPSLPAGTVAGDLLLMFIETSAAVITASGWLSAPSSPQEPTATRLTILYRIATGTDPTTTSDSGDHQLAGIHGVVAGTFDPVSPFNASAGSTQTSTTAVSIPGSTTTVNDCLIFAVVSGNLPDASTGGTEFSSLINADLTNLQILRNSTTAQGNGGALGVFSGEKATAGAYGATTATAANAAARGVISLAIAPPAAIENPYPYVGGGYYPA